MPSAFLIENIMCDQLKVIASAISAGPCSCATLRPTFRAALAKLAVDTEEGTLEGPPHVLADVAPVVYPDELLPQRGDEERRHILHNPPACPRLALVVACSVSAQAVLNGLERASPR